MNVLLEVIVKPSLILALGLMALPLLRGRSAAVRHALLSAALLGAAVVPVVGPLAPAWDVPLPIGSRVTETSSGDVTSRESVIAPDQSAADARAVPSALSTRAERPRAVGSILGWIWLVGAVSGIAVLIVGFRRLFRLASASRRMLSGPWVDRAGAIGSEYGFRRPVLLLEAERSGLLVTWGIRQPKIIVPSAARGWTDDRVSVVLAHELAHIRRGDWIVMIAAELLRAVYWFNPLFWVASALLRHESE